MAKTVTDSFMCNIHIENTVRKNKKKIGKEWTIIYVFFFNPSGMLITQDIGNYM